MAGTNATSPSSSPLATSTVASIRASCEPGAVDDETGEWWGMCNYYIGPGIQMLGWIHEDHLRPSGDLTDDDGVVEPGPGVIPA